MNRVDRAKQFLPFDAMKGLKEALLEREEKLSRVAKHDFSEETKEELSYTLSRITNNTEIEMTFYRKGHYYDLLGTVSRINTVYQYLLIGEEKIFIDDIYSLSILDG